MPSLSPAQTEELYQRVIRGYALIAQASQGQWIHRLDPGLVSFTEPGADPLSQVFGSFHQGLMATGIREAQAAHYGLVAEDDEDARQLRKHWFLHLTTILVELSSYPPH